ncbi:MAG: hypothetical protein K5681_08210 [Treponema sp.]|nr:hypothetical protein [Treponema sp.]
MKKNYFSRLFAIAMVIASLALVGCNEPEEASVYGTWASEYNDGYEISESTIVYDDGGYGYGWEGTIEEVADSYIYYSISGKYFALAYKDLTTSSCKFSNAYKTDGLSYTDTLDEAKTEFTVDNGYYSYFGEYAKE